MTDKHTPEPWQGIDVLGLFGDDVYGMQGERRTVLGAHTLLTRADRDRIVACINFCRHVSTEFLLLHFASEDQPDLDRSKFAMNKSCWPDVPSKEFMGWMAISSDQYTRQ